MTDTRSQQNSAPASFDITWQNGAYYVSVPNYQGGTVYTKEAVEARIQELETSLEILRTANHTMRETLAAVRGATIEAAAGIAKDHTPAKHDGTLAAHVVGVMIEKSIRAMQPQVAPAPNTVAELVFKIIDDRLAQYDDIKAHGGLSSVGRHAEIAIKALRYDIQHGLASPTNAIRALQPPAPAATDAVARRKEIARIIEPRAFIIENSKRFETRELQAQALAKADTILALGGVA